MPIHDSRARKGARLLLSTTQVAQRLGVTRQRVGQLITRGQLRATRVGHAWLVLSKDVDAYCPRPVGRPRKNGE